MARGKRSNNTGKNRILNVRVADPAAGTDGLHVDRMISDVKDSESQTRILVGDLLDLNTTAAGVDGAWGFDQLFSTDDFTSMIQQWSLFRVRAIKFDIYDVNQSVPVYNVWGIWHDNYEGTAPTFTRANVADLPDSRVISAGTGQTTLYWVAHGTTEMGFQASSTTGSPIQKFGGLRYFYGGTALGPAKFALQVHAVVDFRGRR
jgi:hypothetical protein